MLNAAKLTLLTSVIGASLLAVQANRPIGEACSEQELAGVVGLGCGEYIGTSWSGCEGDTSEWWCDQAAVPFQGYMCTDSDACPGLPCTGPANSYCYSGWSHSGLMCTVTTVSPCCSNNWECSTLTTGSYLGLPTYECGCSLFLGPGAPVGSRTVAAYGGTCPAEGSGDGWEGGAG
jgi:hypothetical protein